MCKGMREYGKELDRYRVDGGKGMTGGNRTRVRRNTIISMRKKE